MKIEAVIEGGRMVVAVALAAALAAALQTAVDRRGQSTPARTTSQQYDSQHHTPEIAE